MNPFRSWLGTANFLLFQFLFVRVFAYGDTASDLEERPKYGLLGFVIPLTGWWGPFFPKPLFEWKF